MQKSNQHGMIEPGMLPGQAALLEELRALRESPASITDVIFSHHHLDHTLNAARFQTLGFTITGPSTRAIPGRIGKRIYGRLDCPAALRAIARSGYVTHLVFFLTEEHALAAGYRPCAVCLHWRMHADKHSKITDPVAGQFMREDAARPCDPFKSNRWNDNTRSTHDDLEGGTS